MNPLVLYLGRVTGAKSQASWEMCGGSTLAQIYHENIYRVREGRAFSPKKLIGQMVFSYVELKFSKLKFGTPNV